MALSSIGDGGVHNVVGSFGNVGFKMGLILPYLDRVFVGLHSLLRVRIKYYACCGPPAAPLCFITRADDFLRVRIFYYACGY